MKWLSAAAIVLALVSLKASGVTRDDAQDATALFDVGGTEAYYLAQFEVS